MVARRPDALMYSPTAAPRSTEDSRVMTSTGRLPRSLAVLTLATCLSLAPHARAADAPPPLDRNLRKEIIDGAAAELERTYVEPDTAKLIANVLRKRLKSGAY